MKDLLPFVERDLSLFGDYFKRFAEQYPAIAGDLKLQSDSGGDPDIRNLTQAAAVLNARTAKKLDDDYPELTSSFLDMLVPHLLRPFPSCSTARFEQASGVSKTTGATIVPRRTQLKTAERNRDGIICKFKSVYPVTLAPISVASAKFRPFIQTPPGMRVPLNVTSEIALTIEWETGAAESAGCPIESLRLFVDGDPSFCAAVLDTLFLRTVYVETVSGRRQTLDKPPLMPVVLNDDEALLPTSAKTHSALRLLSEYFCFPGKFNFFDIALSAFAAGLPVGCQRMTLHFALADVNEETDVTRLLKPLSAKHLVVGCTPIVNLFTQAACPIRLNHTARQYTLIPDALRASAFQVYSVDNVRMIHGASGIGAAEFRPYYSLRHGEDAIKKGHYWIMRRDEVQPVTNPGYENLLSFFDVDFAPLTSTSSTISVDLTCCNGDLPNRLDYGAPGGDFAVETSIGNHRIRLMRRPTLSCPTSSGRNRQWKLASHLALSMSSLCQEGLSAFQEMLAMHDRTLKAWDCGSNVAAGEGIDIEAPEMHITTKGTQANYGVGQITQQYSGDYAVKSGRFVHSSSGDGNPAKVDFPKSTLETDERIVVAEPQTGLPIKGRAYTATLEDGTVMPGKTDDQGRTELIKSPDMSKVTLTFDKE